MLLCATSVADNVIVALICGLYGMQATMTLRFIMRLGTRLREIRAARNLTQKDIADQLNISRSTYAHYELGSREPDIETLKRISAILNVSLDYISGNTSCQQTADQLIEYLSSQAESSPDLRISDLDLKNLD